MLTQQTQPLRGTDKPLHNQLSVFNIWKRVEFERIHINWLITIAKIVNDFLDRDLTITTYDPSQYNVIYYSKSGLVLAYARHIQN